MGELRILTSMNMRELQEVIPPHMLSPGDTKVIFDPENADEVEVAKEQFDALLRKGFTAYTVGKDHEKNKKVTSFDPKEGKYILVPKLAGG